MQYTKIKFYREDCGYDTDMDDESITISFDDLYISEESLTKIKETIASIDVHDAMGLDRIKVSYWEDIEEYRPIKGKRKGRRKT
jgi:hypothetical protein